MLSLVKPFFQRFNLFNSTCKHSRRDWTVRLEGVYFCHLASFPLINVTPGSPGKFLMAAFVRLHAQKVTAEIYPVQLIVIWHAQPAMVNHMASQNQSQN